MITQPGTAVIGDPGYPAEVITYTSLRDLNQRITAAAYATTELSGAVRCPACLTSGGLYATVTLLYRRGRQPVACTVGLCDSHAAAEAERITSYGWPHLLLEDPVPGRLRTYELTTAEGYAAVSACLGDQPDVLALFTAGAAPRAASPVPVPEPAGAPA